MQKIYKSYLEAIMMNDEDKVKIIMPVAAGLVVKEGENGEKLLLLIQRSSDDHWPNFWECPRGKCDFGKNESLIHCLKREVKEETGLDVIPDEEIDTFEYLADKGTRKSICHNFLCKLKDPNQKVKLSKEHQDYKWIQSVGEAEMLVLPDQKKSIDKAFNTDLQIVSYPENHFTKNNSVEEYLNNLQEAKNKPNFILPDRHCIILIITEKNQKVESKKLEGEIYLRDGNKIYSGEIDMYYKDRFIYSGESLVGDGFNIVNIRNINKFDPIEAQLISYESEMKEGELDNIRYKISDKKPVKYFPVGNSHFTCFAFFKWNKINKLPGGGLMEIDNIKVASHIIKPYKNFREINILSKEDHPKYGAFTCWYVLK